MKKIVLVGTLLILAIACSKKEMHVFVNYFTFADQYMKVKTLSGQADTMLVVHRWLQADNKAATVEVAVLADRSTVTEGLDFSLSDKSLSFEENADQKSLQLRVNPTFGEKDTLRLKLNYIHPQGVEDHLRVGNVLEITTVQ